MINSSLFVVKKAIKWRDCWTDGQSYIIFMLKKVNDMSRLVKKAEERKLEIIKTAEKLFRENGYSKASVEAVNKEMEVAKGTFYYYFKSKEYVLKAIVDCKLAQVVKMAELVVNNTSMDALAKMQLLLSDSYKLSPVLAKIVEKGNEEKVFNTKRPLETIRFLLMGFQFLMNDGLFDFSEQEVFERRIAMQEIIEKALGARNGTFDFMNKNINIGQRFILL